MVKIVLFLVGFLLSFSCIIAQDTFSIVAVDSITGEVGCAGASCLDDKQFPGSGGVQIIGKLFPGLGAINTQAMYNSTNQMNAGNRLVSGLSPEEVLQWLETNDIQSNAAIRQYGIAAFDANGSPSAAAFTGVNCMDYKNHNVGTYYSIQGNILLNQGILDSMESRFLNTNGSLADRMMAALQGANVPGADTRCMDEGVSSLSAFMRVAKPDDTNGNYYLDLIVPWTDFGVEPIDELQVLYDDWKLTSRTNNEQNQIIKFFPNPAIHTIFIDNKSFNQSIYSVTLRDLLGRVVFKDFNCNKIPVQNLNSGIYLLDLEIEYNQTLCQKVYIYH